MEKKRKLQQIHLKSGIEVTVDWNSKTKCKKCNLGKGNAFDK